MLKADEIFTNEMKRKLSGGQRTIGAWLQIGSSITAEIFGKAGFDFVMVDMEHGLGDYTTLIGQLQAMAKFDAVPFVRAPWNDFVAIKKILDTGVHGVLVPYVNTAEEAAQAVRACKYPPQGIRGIAPSPRAGGYGMDGVRYLERANKQVVVMTAVETPEAVGNIKEIVKTAGLDGIFIGPMDLATSMGYFCNPSAPQVQDAIAKIEKNVSGSGKFLGTVAGSFEQAQALYEKGYHFIVVMSDSTSLAKLAKENVNKFRAAYPNG